MKTLKIILVVSLFVMFSTTITTNMAFADEDQNLTTVRKLVDAFNLKNIAMYDEIYSSNLNYYGTGEGAKLNLDGLKQFMSGIFTAFPDGKLTIDELIAKGDKVVYRVTYKGTQTGDMPGVPATGKVVQARSIGIVRLENGKIVEEWENFDDMGMMQQLGVIPISEAGQQSK
jgi:steroid delta-isomerase-like uncharacterized protein